MVKSMNNKETFGGEIGKQVPVKDIYNDLAHPSLSTVGQALQGLTRVALSPVTALVWGYDKICGYLEVAIPEYFANRKIDKDKIQTPDPAIAVPIIEAMRYTSHKTELRELFTNLLGAAMNSDTAQTVHPAYVEIVKQLETDEAKLLKKMTPTIVKFYPLINVKLKYGVGDGVVFIKWFTDLGFDVCEKPEKIGTYLENLERLKLIEVPPLMSFTDNQAYEELFNHPAIKKESLLEKIPDDMKFGYDKLVFNLTSFGVDFIKACN